MGPFGSLELAAASDAAVARCGVAALHNLSFWCFISPSQFMAEPGLLQGLFNLACSR